MKERSHLNVKKFGQIYLFVFAHFIIAGVSAQRRASPSPVARLTEGTLQGKKKSATHSRAYTLSDWWFLPPGGNALSFPARPPLLGPLYDGAYVHIRMGGSAGVKEIKCFQTV